MSGVFQLPDQAPCPECGLKLDGAGLASGVDTGEPPEVGNYTVCGDCLTLLRYAPGGRFDRVTSSEVAMLDPIMRRVIAEGLVFARAFRMFRRAQSG